MENCVRGRAGGRVREEAAVGSSLPLPPPPRLVAAANSSNAAAAAAAASIRAHLARTASGVDAQPSPRSLLSRILLRGGGGGDGGSAFGCRVRLPRRYGGGLREERKDGADQGETPRVMVVEPPPPLPELPLETPRSSLGRKKPEEELVSMNLGLGASLVLLLSKSAVELNKMVELRAQMEALVSEIRQAARWKQEQEEARQQANHHHHHLGAAPAPAASSTSQESDGNSSATTTAVKDPIAFPAADADADAASNSSHTATDTAVEGRRTAVVMDLMEAELQAELSRMERQRGGAVHGHGGGDNRMAPMPELELPLLKVKTNKGGADDSASRSCVEDGANNHNDDEVDGNVEDDDDEEYEEEDDEGEEEDGGYGADRMSPPHGGVSARALERRLHELLQKRQQDRIVELESALDSAQRRLHEKEREVVWWRDAAKLVSHRRDESRRIAR